MEITTAPKKKSTGLRIIAYVLIFLTVIMSLVGLRNILGAASSENDLSRQIGIMISSLIFPVLFGFLARYCWGKSQGS